MSRPFIDVLSSTQGGETALTLTGRALKPASWRERVAVICFVAVGVVFWAAVVLALFG
jgi:hypothetical protein